MPKLVKAVLAARHRGLLTRRVKHDFDEAGQAPGFRLTVAQNWLWANVYVLWLAENNGRTGCLGQAGRRSREFWHYLCPGILGGMAAFAKFAAGAGLGGAIQPLALAVFIYKLNPNRTGPVASMTAPGSDS